MKYYSSKLRLSNLAIKNYCVASVHSCVTEDTGNMDKSKDKYVQHHSIMANLAWIFWMSTRQDWATGYIAGMWMSKQE